MTDFFQEGPARRNLFLHTPGLRAWLRRKLPPPVLAEVEPDIAAFGARCARELWPLAREAEREPPSLLAYDAWGRRIDQLRLSPAWGKLRSAAAQEGLVALAYERRHDSWSRPHQFAKLFLFHPASAFVSCPVAMTDGAARVLERIGTAAEHRQATARLVARAPEAFWTSGQWMTERTGGSDVSGTTTQALPAENGWTLHGVKYFVSAAESEIALALARKPGAAEGSRGLTLFMARPRSDDGSWNGVRVLRLKDKLGTRALATAELELVACPAIQVGDDGDGVRTVATMLNITRLHNAICATAEAAQALASLKDYAARRIVFGQPLAAQPLQKRLVAELETEVFASVILTLELAHLLGREETGEASADEQNVLRLMTPVCKIVTAQGAVRVASAVVEGFGGAGYIEDVGVARHLRDAQVFSIWEGPSHVLALDMLRALRNGDALEAVVRDMGRRLSRARSPEMEAHVKALQAEASSMREAPPALQQASALELSVHLGALYAAAIALEWAADDPAVTPCAAALIARIPPWRPARQADMNQWESIAQRGPEEPSDAL